MVERFESAEFAAHAARQESRWAPPQKTEAPLQPLVAPACVLGILALVAVLRQDGFSWGHLSTGEPDPLPPPATPLVPVPAPLPSELDGGLYMATFGRRPAESLDVGPRLSSEAPPRQAPEARYLRPDFTLLGIAVACVAVCVVPRPLAAAAADAGGAYGGGAWGSSGMAASPWSSSQKAGNPWGTTPTPGTVGPALGAAAPLGSLATGTSSPFGPSGIFGGNSGAFGGAGGSAGSFDAPMGAAGYGAGAVPQPWGNGQLFGNAAAASPLGGPPSEQELAETQRAFGGRVPRWGQAVQQFLHAHVLSPLLQHLDASDRQWQEALGSQGWHLSFEEPGGYPLSGMQQRLSVFEQQLPPQLRGIPEFVAQWQERQRLERFLQIRGYEASRKNVLERLRNWQRRGQLQQEWRQTPGAPSDGHIVENLLLLAMTMMVEGFEQRYVASAGGMPNLLHHGGEQTLAFLRQVTDQTSMPMARPPPHYEVVTGGRSWRLAPGPTNLPEALGLLLVALKQQPRSYMAFPEALRQALEASEAPFSSVSGALSWLRQGFGAAWRL